MKKSKIFGFVTSALVALSVSVTTIPAISPLVSSAAETKSFELKSYASPVKASLTWNFDAPVSRSTDYTYANASSDIKKAKATLRIANPGYSYTNVKIDGKNFGDNTTANITYDIRTGVSAGHSSVNVILPVDKGFTVTADVTKPDSYNPLTSKNAWQTQIDGDYLDAVLSVTAVSDSTGNKFKPAYQKVTPAIVAETGKVSTFTSDTGYFGGREFVNGVTVLTDEQKQNILKASNIDITFNLSSAPNSPVPVKLYLSDSNILNPNDVSRVFSGTANPNTRAITFSNVKLTPAGNTTAFFNNYVLATDTAYSVLDQIRVTNVTAALTFPDSTAPNTVLPAPPFVPNSIVQNVRALRYTTTIDVSWNPMTSARYGIYYIHFDAKGNPSNWTVKAIDTNTYTIPNPVHGATYYITVLPFSDNPRQYGGFSPYTIVKT